MFKFVVLALFVACVAADADVDADVTQYVSDVRADGFHHTLETTNGIHQGATGDEHGNIKGGYEFISPEGEHVHVDYIANEHGYQPVGAVIPTPPPVPEAIVKALEYLRTHATPEPKVL